MTELKHYNYTHFPFLNYSLDDFQIQFTATVPKAIRRIETRKINGDFSAHAVTVMNNQVPCGFFILDFGSDKYEFTTEKNSVLLRSFSINPKFQGNGIGKNTVNLLSDFIRKYFPETKLVVLAVNERNVAAISLYEKTGFKFDEKTREGASGMQRIMFKNV